MLALAHHGRLVLLLDGWNELDREARLRASSEIKRLRRDFPSLGIVVSTRRQALDVPMSGPMVQIGAQAHAHACSLLDACRAWPTGLGPRATPRPSGCRRLGAKPPRRRGRGPVFGHSRKRGRDARSAARKGPPAARVEGASVIEEGGHGALGFRCSAHGVILVLGAVSGSAFVRPLIVASYHGKFWFG